MPSLTEAEFQQEISARLGRGDVAGAAAAAAQCRTQWPAASAGWLFGSIAALLVDDPETALTLIDTRIAAAADDGQCLLQRAECLLALGRRDASMAAAAAAADHVGDIPAALDAVGEFLFHAGEYRRALEVYDRAVGLAPADPVLRAKRADVHRVLGQFALAVGDYENALRIAPGSAKALKALTELRGPSTGQSVAALDAALDAARADSADASILHFALAKAHDDQGDHARSWRHLQAANRIERSRLQYRSADDIDFIAHVMDEFPTLEVPRRDAGGERPIFIVGIPRTGTTLVERIIGSHSSVHGAGEITAMPEAIDAVRAQSSKRLGELDASAVAAEYLARSRGLRGERPRFTDKLLTNFFHCALILRAFPAASIVHVTRHPLAACHAIYRTRFNGTYPFAYDLDEIAGFYVGYRRLMAHWERVLPGRILTVSYEEVVTALEPAARRLLAALDLAFEPACLEFHRNASPVKTTSTVQVRQPLYDSSLHAWRHYAAELEPVRSRLASAGIPTD